jgi:nodulation protein E
MRRVVLTGAGTVNALAHDVPATLTALQEGACGIGPLEFRDAERLEIRIGAQVRGWGGLALSQRETALFDPVTRLALAAADEAVAMAGLEKVDLPAGRAGVVIGTAAGGISTWDDSYRAVFAEGRNRVPPLVVPRLMHNAPASHISIRHGLTGPAFAVSSACASASHAIGLAFQMVRSGVADVMLAGGAEAMLCFGGVKAWEGLRVLSPKGCQPFDANRSGMVIGDGAAVFVLESLERAKARGARPLAELAGFAMNSDAHDIVAPSAAGAAAAMTQALADAGMAATDIGYVNAHGTGTHANDRSECAAMRLAFGTAAQRMAVSSTKGAHGHAIGAAGAIELLAVLSAFQGQMPPTVGCATPADDCDLDIITGTARAAPVGAALSNSFAFGGLNAVLVLRAIDA